MISTNPKQKEILKIFITNSYIENFKLFVTVKISEELAKNLQNS